MDANGLFTVITILLAAYALLPSEKREDIRMQLSFLRWCFIIFPLICIIIVILSPVLLHIGMPPIEWILGFDKETTIFFYLVLILVFIIYIISRRKLPKANYEKLAKRSVLLFEEKKFRELDFLWSKYIERILEKHSKETWLSKLCFATKSRSFSLTMLPDENSKQKEPKKCKLLGDFFKKIISKRKQKSEQFEKAIYSILSSKSFTYFLAENHPLLAAKLTLPFCNHDSFVNNYFEWLISNNHSSLYRELIDDYNHNYFDNSIDKSNILLCYYFNDISKAEKVGIWKPIGDYITHFIEEQKGKDNYYNRANNDFSEKGKITCPIFISILFFRKMVQSAIIQNSDYHMSLTYFKFFNEKIIESLDRNENVDQDLEFPSKFDYLLWELFDVCIKWLLYGKEEQRYLGQEIRSWVAKTLGEMFQKIIVSEKLSLSQRTYYFEYIIQTTNKLDRLYNGQYSDEIFTGCIDDCRNQALYGLIMAFGTVYNSTSLDQQIKFLGSSFIDKFKELAENNGIDLNT